MRMRASSMVAAASCARSSRLPIPGHGSRTNAPVTCPWEVCARLQLIAVSTTACGETRYGGENLKGLRSMRKCESI